MPGGNHINGWVQAVQPVQPLRSVQISSLPTLQETAPRIVYTPMLRHRSRERDIPYGPNWNEPYLGPFCLRNEYIPCSSASVENPPTIDPDRGAVIRSSANRELTRGQTSTTGLSWLRPTG